MKHIQLLVIVVAEEGVLLRLPSFSFYNLLEIHRITVGVFVVCVCVCVSGDCLAAFLGNIYLLKC